MNFIGDDNYKHFFLYQFVPVTSSHVKTTVIVQMMVSNVLSVIAQMDSKDLIVLRKVTNHVHLMIYFVAGCFPQRRNVDFFSFHLIHFQFHCDIVLPCEVSPCQNGGICSNEKDGKFKCVCHFGYTGLVCTRKGIASLIITLEVQSPLMQFYFQ